MNRVPGMRGSGTWGSASLSVLQIPSEVDSRSPVVEAATACEVLASVAAVVPGSAAVVEASPPVLAVLSEGAASAGGDEAGVGVATGEGGSLASSGAPWFHRIAALTPAPSAAQVIRVRHRDAGARSWLIDGDPR
jgi:hypothetical protein